ncbi:MAG: nuclear transport factor 2 family protein [Planctomycetota bacterium]
MRITVLLGSWCAVLGGCTSTDRGMRLEGAGVRFGSDDEIINGIVDSWHAAAATGDADVYFGLMTETAVFLGTDATERWPADEFRAFAEPYFDGVEAWTYTPRQRWIEVAPGGDVAWFDELLWNDKYGTSRGAGMVVRDGDGLGWKIAAYSLSFPIPNDLAGRMTSEIKAYEAEEVSGEDG